MPAGGLGREADDSARRPRAPRRLLVRVALTEGLGVTRLRCGAWTGAPGGPEKLADSCERRLDYQCLY